MRCWPRWTLRPAVFVSRFSSRSSFRALRRRTTSTPRRVTSRRLGRAHRDQRGSTGDAARSAWDVGCDCRRRLRRSRASRDRGRPGTPSATPRPRRSPFTTSRGATVYDPVTGTHTPATVDTGYNIFCAGFAHLYDGRCSSPAATRTRSSRESRRHICSTPRRTAGAWGRRWPRAAGIRRSRR